MQTTRVKCEEAAEGRYKLPNCDAYHPTPDTLTTINQELTP